jgi:hypothetical protein
MTPEGLLYPWKKDLEKAAQEMRSNYDYRIQTLEQNLNDLRLQNDNLKMFCQQLYDRLNLGTSNYNSNPLNKVY